ncbi:MAG: OmpA family protein [Oscillospiraceae bacterium]|nr:OmpA family protein [Oscillospiraceae bacterium]
MKKKKNHEGSHDNTERWLLSYADFITLLMVFFVVMYSMSRVDQIKFYQLAQSLSSAFVGGTGNLQEGTANSNMQIPIDLPTWPATSEDNTSDTTSAAESTDSTEPTAPTEPTSMDANAIEQAAQNLEMNNLKKIEEQLADYFIKENLNDAIMLHIDSRGLVISLNAAVLFDSGSAVVKPEMADTLIGVGSIIDKLDNYIRVEGHTDNVPVGVSQYKTNWELSTARATNVVELFINQVGINPLKLVAAGYSEYRPIASNDTSEGRSQNRRVDIIILNSKYNDLENQLTDVASLDKTPEQILQEASSAVNTNNTETSDTTVPLP